LPTIQIIFGRWSTSAFREAISCCLLALAFPL
jgi:hypothetical protein